MGTLDGKAALVTGSGGALLDAAQGPGLSHQEDLVVAYREDRGISRWPNLCIQREPHGLGWIPANQGNDGKGFSSFPGKRNPRKTTSQGKFPGSVNCS